jgi:hypothetical protein
MTYSLQMEMYANSSFGLYRPCLEHVTDMMNFVLYYVLQYNVLILYRGKCPCRYSFCVIKHRKEKQWVRELTLELSTKWRRR